MGSVFVFIVVVVVVVVFWFADFATCAIRSLIITSLFFLGTMMADSWAGLVSGCDATRFERKCF